jgi:hypothetical protein
MGTFVQAYALSAPASTPGSIAAVVPYDDAVQDGMQMFAVFSIGDAAANPVCAGWDAVATVTLTDGLMRIFKRIANGEPLNPAYWSFTYSADPLALPIVTVWILDGIETSNPIVDSNTSTNTSTLAIPNISITSDDSDQFILWNGLVPSATWAEFQALQDGDFLPLPSGISGALYSGGKGGTIIDDPAAGHFVHWTGLATQAAAGAVDASFNDSADGQTLDDKGIMALFLRNVPVPSTVFDFPLFMSH